MKVIVVDDNKVELREVCRLVEDSELNLTVVGKFVNGKDAYEFIMENKVDIVISDIQMPIMDGIELINKINQNRKMVEVIFISCYDDFSYMRSALKNDVFDYILKPINKHEFKIALKSLCEKCTVQNNIARAREEAGKKLEKYQKIVEEEFLRLHILGTYDLEKEGMVVYEFPELLRSSKITVAKGKIVYVTDVKENEGFWEKKAWIINLVKQQIESMADDCLKVYSVIVSLNEVAVIFIEEDTAHDIEGGLIEFKQRLAQEFGIYLSFGISNSGIMPGELRELYLQAEEALGYAFGSKKSYIIRYEDIAFKNHEDIDTKQILESVKNIIMKGDKADIISFVEKYITAEMKHQSYLKKSAYAVMYSVEMVLLEYGQTLSAILGNGMWEKLNSFETIVDPAQWISNMLALAVDGIHLKKDEDSENKIKIVDEVKRIVRKRYSEKLTIGMIAEELHYSSKYISGIFLEVEKKSIFEYLTRYRMEVAKTMLKEPDSKIYMVVESVGYKRKTHFYDVFKSYVGVTPMEYKEMYSRGGALKG